MAQNSNMSGKVVLITGATNGIGAETALQLARMNATVVVHGRSETRAKATVDRVIKETGNPNVNYLLADLSVMAQVRDLAAQFKRQYTRLDVLINNAGAVFMTREVTPDGCEMTFALNHLNYFLLTNLLLEMLKDTAAKYGEARVINVSSDAHHGAQKGLNFDDLQSSKGFNGMGVYARSKLANILFSNELARRLEGTGVVSNALHPGLVRSGFGKNNNLAVKLAVTAVQVMGISPQKGAETSIYLASSPEVKGITGQYFRSSKPAATSAYAKDEAAARRLWDVSAELTGLTTAV